MFTFTSRPPSARKGERRSGGWKRARPAAKIKKAPGFSAHDSSPRSQPICYSRLHLKESAPRLKSSTFASYSACIFRFVAYIVTPSTATSRTMTIATMALFFTPFSSPSKSTRTDSRSTPPFYHNITIQSIHQIRSAFERIIRQIAASAGPHPACAHSDRRNAPSARALTSGRTSQSAEASRPYSARPFGRRNRAPARIASRIRCPQRP